MRKEGRQIEARHADPPSIMRRAARGVGEENSSSGTNITVRRAARGAGEESSSVEGRDADTAEVSRRRAEERFGEAFEAVGQQGQDEPAAG